MRLLTFTHVAFFPSFRFKRHVVTFGNTEISQTRRRQGKRRKKKEKRKMKQNRTLLGARILSILMHFYSIRYHRPLFFSHLIPTSFIAQWSIREKNNESVIVLENLCILPVFGFIQFFSDVHWTFSLIKAFLKSVNLVWVCMCDSFFFQLFILIYFSSKTLFVNH